MRISTSIKLLAICDITYSSFSLEPTRSLHELKIVRFIQKYY